MSGFDLTIIDTDGKMSHDYPGHEQRMARYIERAAGGLDIFTGEPIPDDTPDDEEE